MNAQSNNNGIFDASTINLLISSDIDEVRIHLRAMVDSYLLLSEGEMDHPKNSVYDSYYVLDESLKKLQEQKIILKMP